LDLDINSNRRTDDNKSRIARPVPAGHPEKIRCLKLSSPDSFTTLRRRLVSIASIVSPIGGTSGMVSGHWFAVTPTRSDRSTAAG
jgi:hypothetical protein